MTDQDQQPPVRRIGRKDRKRRLTSTGELFPPGADSTPLPAETAQAVSQPEIVIPEPEPQPAPAVTYTPPDERYPPVAPTLPKNLRPRTAARQPMARRHRVARHDWIALLFFGATVLAIIYFVYIWQNPYSPLNILQPARPVIYVTATPGASTSLEGTAAATTAATPDSFVFRVDGEPVYSASDAASAADCSGDSITIGGSVQGSADPAPPYAVRVSSDTRDEGILTGATTWYGENGFIFTLPRDTAQYRLELFDTAGQPLAAPVSIEVRPGCDASEVIVRFVFVTSR